MPKWPGTPRADPARAFQPGFLLCLKTKVARRGAGHRGWVWASGSGWVLCRSGVGCRAVFLGCFRCGGTGRTTSFQLDDGGDGIRGCGLARLELAGIGATSIRDGRTEVLVVNEAGPAGCFFAR